MVAEDGQVGVLLWRVARPGAEARVVVLLLLRRRGREGVGARGGAAGVVGVLRVEVGGGERVGGVVEVRDFGGVRGDGGGRLEAGAGGHYLRPLMCLCEGGWGCVCVCVR